MVAQSHNPLTSSSPSTGKATWIKNVLVAVDFSEASRRALRYGAALARHFGASLVALHVVEPVSVETDFGYGTFIRHMTNLAALNVSKTRLTGLGRKLGSALSAITRSGCVPEEIIRAAKEMDTDLILLGSKEVAVQNGQALGGTVPKVLSHAPCPVLVVGQNIRACGVAPI